MADDGDWSTRIRWRIDGGAYVAQISWEIPADTPTGEYRLTHSGYDGADGNFSGVSELIYIDP